MRWSLKLAWLFTLSTAGLLIFLSVAGPAVVLYVFRTLDEYEIVRFPLSSKFSSEYAENRKAFFQGFEPVALSVEKLPAPTCTSIIFAGHIYPRNGYNGGAKPLYPDPDNALSAFLDFVQLRNPNRVVFGGDSVWGLDEGELTWLQDIKRKVGTSKFIVGNHDILRDGGSTTVKELHNDIYGVPFEAVTVDDVLLIYFQSIKSDGSFGIPRHQIEFLDTIARSTAHKYAVMFSHTVLWESDPKFSNSNYPDVEEINRTWNDEVLPLLKSGRVKMVVAGDGGIKHAGVVSEESDITHIVSGWPRFRTDIPIEWLEIGLCDSDPQLTRYRLLEGKLYKSIE
jgi:hypothetical protein